ncbi:MAG: serine/threonine-protein kinase [Myxococcota bacterium]
MTISGPWSPQTTVGRYQLLTPLASGGMAEIWLARQPGLRGFEKLVVIKRMVGALEDDPDHVEMFLSEARLAAQFSHPHIVQIYELGEEKGSFFIVMEFLDGESLSSVFKQARRDNKPMPDHLVARLGAWAAEGLHYAHTRVDEHGRPLCIVHRDVSPQNLLVTFDGSLKVVDFGIAKIATHATSSGKLKGKLAYMAPEQARTQAVDARTDVFALGVVLFELLARGRLFPRAEDFEILTKMASLERFPRLSERRIDISPGLDEIVAKAMQANAAQRYQSAAELQAALEDWLVSTGQRATAADVSEYLRELFAERIATRKSLIDAARRGEVMPAGAGAFVSSPSGSGSSSLSGGKPATTPDRPVEASISMDPTMAASMQGLPRAGGKGPVRMIVAGVLVLAAAALGVRFLKAPAEVEAPTTPPVEARAEVDSREAPPPSVSATLTVEATPAEATIRIDGQPQGQGPYSLAPGEHLLETGAAGYVTDTRKVTLHDGERVSLIIKLEHTPQAAVDPPSPMGATKRPDKTPKAAAKGTLKIDTVPWTTVYVGGKKLGDTPILNAKLPAGKHVLRLVNPEAGVEQSIEVEIVANAETVKKLRLK